MANLDDIRQGLKALCAGPINTVVATVKSVDEDTLSMVCTPAGGGADYEEVRLKATIGDDESGVYVIPKAGTSVLLGIINDDPDSTYLHLAQSVNKIILIVGNSKIVMTNGKIEMNEGSLGGLVKIDTLVSQINAIKTDINALKTALTAWVPASGDGGLALKTAITAYSGQVLQPLLKKEIEDTKITH